MLLHTVWYEHRDGSKLKENSTCSFLKKIHQIRNLKVFCFNCFILDPIQKYYFEWESNKGWCFHQRRNISILETHIWGTLFFWGSEKRNDFYFFLCPLLFKSPSAKLFFTPESLASAFFFYSRMQCYSHTKKWLQV